MKKNSKIKIKHTLEEELVDLYLKIKVRKNEDIDIYDEKALEKEREKLKGTSNLVILNYIKSSIDILVKLKAEEMYEELSLSNNKLNTKGREKNGKETLTEKSEVSEKEGISNPVAIDEPANEYEAMLIKAEADIRFHLRTQHQLKLHCDNLQSKIDDLEKVVGEQTLEINILKKELNQNKFKEITEIKELEIQKLKLELDQIKPLMKSYEDQSIKILELEKKLLGSKEQEKELREKLMRQSEQIKVQEDLKKTNQSYKLNFNDEFESNNLLNKLAYDKLNEKEYLNGKINYYRKIFEKKHQEITSLKMLIDDLRLKFSHGNNLSISQSPECFDKEKEQVQSNFSITRSNFKAEQKVNLNNLSRISVVKEPEEREDIATKKPTILPSTNPYEKENPLDKLSNTLIEKYNIPKNKRTNSELSHLVYNSNTANQLALNGNTDTHNKRLTEAKSHINVQVKQKKTDLSHYKNLSSTNHYSYYSSSVGKNEGNILTVRDDVPGKRYVNIPMPKKGTVAINKENSFNKTGLNNSRSNGQINDSNNATNRYKHSELNLRQYILNKISNKKVSIRNSSVEFDDHSKSTIVKN